MAFACENVASEAGGPVSFQNIMDGIASAEFPAPTGRWFAIFCFISDIAQTIANCRVVVAPERGEAIAQTAVKDLVFTADSRISRNVVAFQGLTWPYPGRYLIQFIANRDDVLAWFPMQVFQAPEGPDATAS
jgi:hypothetical protein